MYFFLFQATLSLSKSSFKDGSNHMIGHFISKLFSYFLLFVCQINGFIWIDCQEMFLM